MRNRLWVMLGCLAAASALGQQPQQASPAEAPIAPADLPAKPAATQDKPTVAPGTPATAQQEAGEPRVKAATATGKKNAVDRVELDTTTITGNKELPKVLYIVPWKRSDIGDVIGRPVNSLLDEILAPVDRDVFRRQIGYYQALKPDSASPAAPGGESVTPAR
jgi:hypothetical protein